jgi:excinuclease ABC subunit C
MNSNDSNAIMHLEDLRKIVREAPTHAGVYLWKDNTGAILYVGKASRLRMRLSSYFNDKSLKTRHLMARVHALEYITVDNQYEALVLENNLIKKHQPKYNIRLKDEKTYPYVRITKEPYPRVFHTRTIVDDGSEYFGPYPMGRIDLYMGLIEKLFKLRKCKHIPLKKRKYPCLYYHMGQSLAPCCGLTTEEEYRKELNKVRSLLSGKTGAFIKELNKEMMQASANLDYERAASLRDAIRAVEAAAYEQNVEQLHTDDQHDYVGMAGGDGIYYFVILKMRSGKLIGKFPFRVESPALADEALSEFLIRYYSDINNDSETQTVFVETIPDDADYNRFFREEAGRMLQVSPPLEERDVKLLRMAYENAMLDLMRETDTETALAGLKTALGLSRFPRHIEGFDVAQLNGHYTVASLISFKNGLPDKKNYRRFRMKSLAAGEINDFKAISEAVARRFTRLLNEGMALPDLLLVDGGKGQVSSAYSVLKALGLEKKVALAGLAKREEELFLPGQSDPVILPVGSPALRLAQAVRDETHRFATTYNQKLRHTTLHLNKLESVHGIGSQKAKKLLMQFGSLQAIARQESSAIAQVAKISREKAEELLAVLQDAGEEDDDGTV